jgi:hypothetical protein
VRPGTFNLAETTRAIEVARCLRDRHECVFAGHSERYAALDRSVSSECGGPLSRGPVGCAPYELAHGFRYAAVETEQPEAEPGNEHAVRVNVSVVRLARGISEREVLVRRLFLPGLLSGGLPGTGQAQAAKDKINRMSVAEIEALFPLMLRTPSAGIP